MEQIFDTSLATKGQREFALARKYPHFAPGDGRCYSCNEQIYEQKDHGGYKSGIGVESASTSLVTGCPHCHHSYCD